MQRELEAVYRERTGKGICRKLRREGLVPAILYGRNQEPLPLAVRLSDLRRTFPTPEARASFITLVIKGLPEGEVRKTALLREIQRDTLKDMVLHVDFQAVAMEEEIYMEVPIVLVGKPKGVEKGGLLEQVLRSVEVKGIAARIPAHIEVDVSNLDIGDTIHVEDLKVEGVTITSDPSLAVATVVAPTEEEEAAEGEETPSV